MGVLGVWKHTWKNRRKYITDPEIFKLLIRHGVLLWNQHTLSCVIDAKVSSPVDDDALHRHVETLVQALQTIRPEDLRKTVAQTFELSLLSCLSHISCQTGTGKIKRVHKTEGCGSGCTTRSQVTSEVPPELGALVNAIKEDLLVLVLEGEVEGLGGKISDDIGKVTSPEGKDSLLLGDTDNAVNDTLVLLVSGDLLTGMLDLK